ncbi:hypothetical protein AB0L05_27610, partial [Nonomuraea pusilla]
MSIDERRIAEELRLMAGEAAPVDPLACATRALARRRRRSCGPAPARSRWPVRCAAWSAPWSR